MNDDELQFAISQYLDGVLPPEQASALEKRLQDDAEARRTFEAFRRLNVLMDSALPAPQADWDQMARTISRAVDTVAPVSFPMRPAESPAARPAWNWRPMLMAASLLLCAGLTLIVLSRREAAPVNLAGGPAHPAVLEVTPAQPTQALPPESHPMAHAAEVDVLHVEMLADVAAVDVQIGGPDLTPDEVIRLHPELVRRRAAVSIAANPMPPRDEEMGVLH